MGWQLSAGPDWPVPLFCQYIQACINAQKILFQPVFLLFLSAGKHREFRPCHHGVRPEATRHLWGQRSVWECQPHSGPVHTHRSGWNGEGSGAHTFTYVSISLKSPLAAHYYLILILFFFLLRFPWQQHGSNKSNVGMKSAFLLPPFFLSVTTTSVSQAKSKGFHSKYDIGVKYAEKQQRRFAPEKLREGRNIIGLQVRVAKGLNV